MSLSGAQCRAARALVDMTQDELALRAETAKRTVAAFESGQRNPYPRTLAAIRTALEHAGVTFLDASATQGMGVRLAEP